MEQALVQKIVGMVKESYLEHTRNRTKNSTNDTVAGVLTHLQDTYGQLMPHEILELEDIVNKTIYNLHNPLATVFSAVDELLEFADITRTSYTQLQAVNISYGIIHWTGKFWVAIRKWNRMPSIQKTWVQFKQFFQISHRELRETSNLTVEDAGMHYFNMVRDVVAGLHEDLQQYQTHKEAPISMQEPMDHVTKLVQNTQQQFATQLQQMQSIMKTTQMHYNTVPHGTHQDYGGGQYYGGG